MKNTILATAYAINPYKGSEDGTGWNFISQIAKTHKCIAITRKNNQTAIENFLTNQPDHSSSNVQFEYFDLPKWMCFWKKGSSGALLYHYLWHLGVVFFILSKKLKFDLAHHVNFHSDWLPSFLWLLGKPFVWGPIGHHHKIPTQYLKFYGQQAILKDRLIWYAKKCFWTFDPFLKLTVFFADEILVDNSSVSEVLPFSKDKITTLPAIASLPVTPKKLNTKKFRVLSIGLFVPLKGFDLTISAFAEFFKIQSQSNQQNLILSLIGKGPERERLEQLALASGIPANAIEFVEWMDREKLNDYFNSSKLFLFPSHEGAGMVVPEALSFGLPVICLDNYGPGESVSSKCGFKIPHTDYETTINALTGKLDQCFRDTTLLNQMSIAATEHFQNNFLWDRKGVILEGVYNNALKSSSLLEFFQTS